MRNGRGRGLGGKLINLVISYNGIFVEFLTAHLFIFMMTINNNNNKKKKVKLNVRYI